MASDIKVYAIQNKEGQWLGRDRMWHPSDDFKCAQIYNNIGHARSLITRLRNRYIYRDTKFFLVTISAGNIVVADDMVSRLFEKNKRRIKRVLCLLGKKMKEADELKLCIESLEAQRRRLIKETVSYELSGASYATNCAQI